MALDTQSIAIYYHCRGKIRSYMAYDMDLADRVRRYLHERRALKITEKKMFGGLAFLVNGMMCVNVSGERLMCRFQPSLMEALACKKGFLPMVMKGKELNGYCYVSPDGFQTPHEFEYWINICLEYNKELSNA